ncbi:MAG: DEAD/DEAH box helicase [Anaerolineae bacterium]
MKPLELLAYLKRQPYYRGQPVHLERLPARRARYGTLTPGLPEPLARALQTTGAARLYSHQVQAIDAARRGEHVVVATGTASGKTLCYNTPVLEAVVNTFNSRALYLFPTKALARDQLRTLAALTAPLVPRPKIGVYDGDTPQKARARLRAEAAVLLTNPDMLHVGILPHHALWASFLRNLRFVVIDEAHTYRGVFGSHVATILRRLNRLCRHYGSNPQYITCSATISNPAEHITRLTGRTPTVVDDDGAPRPARFIILWNPPLLDAAHGGRRSPYGEAAARFADLVRAGVRNITFARARVVAELILKYARASLKRSHPHLLNRVAAYRAGYLAEHRRDVETALFNGELIGVTATNALELGVDVGALDATISVGYPGTIASLWQQGGRAGRRGGAGGRRPSLAVVIGLDNPLDQYFMRHPRQLFDRPHEHALIDPGNMYVLLQHLPCAALELPLSPADETPFGEGFVPAMIELEERGQLVYRPEADNWHYMGRSYPARRVNIRSMGRAPITLRNVADNDRPLEVMDAGIAPARVHPGAIYMHRGDAYRVKSLDIEAGEARLIPVEVDYYTQTRDINHLQIVQPLRRRVLKRAAVYWGRVRVTQRVAGYRQVRYFTESRSKEIPLDLPPRSFQTMAVWWDIPRPWKRAVARRGWQFFGGMQAVEHAAMAILPLFAMCDRWDIGGHTTLSHPDTGAAQIFIYDAHPGGVGISEQGFAMLFELWRAALAAVKECPCQSGCPSCIYSPRAGGKNESLDKRAAVWLLESLLRG